MGIGASRVTVRRDLSMHANLPTWVLYSAPDCHKSRKEIVTFAT